MGPDFKFFVVQRVASVLGQDLFDTLNCHIIDEGAIKIRIIKVQNGEPSGSNSLNRYADINTPDRKLEVPTSSVEISYVQHHLLQRYWSILEVDPKTFIHKPIINELLSPVAQALLRVPLALLENVKSELDRMEHDGVLKQVEASDWVSKMVIARKANGTIRICVDLTDVSKAHRFRPLPASDN